MQKFLVVGICLLGLVSLATATSESLSSQIEDRVFQAEIEAARCVQQRRDIFSQKGGVAPTKESIEAALVEYTQNVGKLIKSLASDVSLVYSISEIFDMVSICHP